MIDESHQCEHEDRGQRCAKLASVSPSTLGGGPWYCWQHARFIHGGHPGNARLIPHARKVPYERKGDGRDWARDILASQAAGVYHYALGIRYAHEALGSALTRGRVIDAVDFETVAERIAIESEPAS